MCICAGNTTLPSGLWQPLSGNTTAADNSKSRHHYTFTLSHRRSHLFLSFLLFLFLLSYIMSSKGGTTPPERGSQQSLMTRSQALSTAFLGTARDKAMGVAHAATSWFTPPSDWTAPLSHLESLTTVMLNPLAAHPVYQSESLAKALQLMQQQQRQRSSSSSSSSNGNELVLHGTTSSAWPSSTELLKAEIPESHAPLSLFQGFAATYPSLAGASSISSSPSNKRSRHKRKKQASHASGIYILMSFFLHMTDRSCIRWAESYFDSSDCRARAKNAWK